VSPSGAASRVDLERVLVNLEELASREFQERVWFAQAGPEVSSISEQLSQLFDDTGLTDALVEGELDQQIGPEAAAALRAVEAAAEEIDQALPPDQLLDHPSMKRLRQCARLAADRLAWAEPPAPARRPRPPGAPKVKLKVVGFFGDLPHGLPGRPTVAESASARPVEDEDRLVEYLREGHPFITSTELAYDVIADPDQQGHPIAHLVILTDGAWVWPADLPHYLERYHVRLPQEFLDHAARMDWRMPDVVLEDLDPTPDFG
jgi:hypothetical protein